MKFLKKLIPWKNKKGEKEEPKCTDGHNCDFVEDIDETMADMNEKIEKILKSDSFGRLMKRDLEGV